MSLSSEIINKAININKIPILRKCIMSPNKITKPKKISFILYNTQGTNRTGQLSN